MLPITPFYCHCCAVAVNNHSCSKKSENVVIVLYFITYDATDMKDKFRIRKLQFYIKRKVNGATKNGSLKKHKDSLS